MYSKVGSLLAGRAASAGVECARTLQNAPRQPSPHPDLTLDDRPLFTAIQHLNFIQMKRKCITFIKFPLTKNIENNHFKFNIGIFKTKHFIFTYFLLAAINGETTLTGISKIKKKILLIYFIFF